MLTTEDGMVTQWHQLTIEKNEALTAAQESIAFASLFLTALREAGDPKGVGLYHGRIGQRLHIYALSPQAAIVAMNSARLAEFTIRLIALDVKPDLTGYSRVDI